MANIKSAAKRAKQAEVRRGRNASVKTQIKSAQRKLNTALTEKKGEEAKGLYQTLSATLDKAAKHGIIHRNLADRKKSNFAKQLAAPAGA